MEDKVLKRIDSKLSSLLGRKTEPETWVKWPVIHELTGWDKEGMRKARINGYIKQKKDQTGIWYLLESLNPIFYKKTSIN